jgi:Leucine-rich repeat (LRR) protein
LDYFALSDHNRTDLHALSHEYVKILDSSNSLLPEAYFIELLKKMMDNKWNFYLVERMIAYDEQQRTHPIHYDSIVLKCLERLGRSSEYQVSFNREERTLGLKGNGIFTLLSSAKESSQKSILRFLNLVELDLSHTSFSRLEELSDMQSLRELNISNTKVERLDFLNHMHVFRLHVAKNQFSSMQMEVLEDWIEVLEKE